MGGAHVGNEVLKLILFLYIYLLKEYWPMLPNNKSLFGIDFKIPCLKNVCWFTINLDFVVP